MSCHTDKVPFETRDAALARIQKDGLDGLAPYECDFCGAWHMGHHKAPGRPGRRKKRSVSKLPTRGTVLRVWEL